MNVRYASRVRVFARQLRTWLTSTSGTLKHQFLRGSAWVVIGDAVTQTAAMVRTVILARLLNPEDFGLMAIALLIQRVLDRFTETGVSAALIQKRGEINGYLDTAWTLQLIRGVIVSLLLIGVAV